MCNFGGRISTIIDANAHKIPSNGLPRENLSMQHAAYTHDREFQADEAFHDRTPFSICLATEMLCVVRQPGTLSAAQNALQKVPCYTAHAL
jgi:hypothetical protein